MSLRCLIAALVLGAALSSCSVIGRLKDEARLTLRCNDEELRVEEKPHGRYAVFGCGRMAICEAPEKSEPQCSGGADALPAAPTAPTEP